MINCQQAETNDISHIKHNHLESDLQSVHVSADDCKISNHSE